MSVIFLTKKEKKNLGFWLLLKTQKDKLVPYPTLGAEQRPYCTVVKRTNTGFISGSTLSCVPQASCFPSLCLCFLDLEMGMIVRSLIQVVVEIE